MRVPCEGRFGPHFRLAAPAPDSILSRTTPPDSALDDFGISLGTERVDRLHANDGEYLPGGRASIVLSQCSVIGNLLRRVGWPYRLRSGDARPLPALPT